MIIKAVNNPVGNAYEIKTGAHLLGYILVHTESELTLVLRSGQTEYFDAWDAVIERCEQLTGE